jgi:uncharacterized protein
LVVFVCLNQAPVVIEEQGVIKIENRAASFLLIILMAVPGLACAQEGSSESQRRIVVSGVGDAVRAPDMAVLSLTVMREAPTARGALDANSAAMEKVIANMKTLGIAARDLQTSAFSINPRYSYPQRNSTGEARKLIGYTVRNSLTVRVRDIARVGEILDASVTMGVNEGGNISFTNDDPSAALTEARVAAVKAATEKARTLAKSADVKLGPVMEISEQSHRSGPVPMMRAEMAMSSDSKSVPVAGGENTYNVSVQMIFAIED